MKATIKQQAAGYQGPVLVSVSELAKILGMARQTIYNQLSTGELPITPRRWGRGKRKKVVFDSRDVEKYINGLPIDERFTNY